MNPFPIPVQVIGPGSQPTDEEELRYLSMPQGMDTFRAPILPEPEEAAPHRLARAALGRALDELAEACRDGSNRRVDLAGLTPGDRELVNQVLGEGEVSAQVVAGGPACHALRVQESVFTGLWRVIRLLDDGVQSDSIELGAIPEELKTAAREDVLADAPRWTGPLPPNVQNAPALLAEIEDQWRRWTPGMPSHVVNLSLLPMSPEDIAFMDHHLGTGRVQILSRGYGNCRITNTRMPNCWRVVYYNSQDTVILNTVEVGELPEVAQASREDLEDSHARLIEVLRWIEGT